MKSYVDAVLAVLDKGFVYFVRVAAGCGALLLVPDGIYRRFNAQAIYEDIEPYIFIAFVPAIAIAAVDFTPRAYRWLVRYFDPVEVILRQPTNEQLILLGAFQADRRAFWYFTDFQSDLRRLERARIIRRLPNHTSISSDDHELVKFSVGERFWQALRKRSRTVKSRAPVTVQEVNEHRELIKSLGQQGDRAQAIEARRQKQNFP